MKKFLIILLILFPITSFAKDVGTAKELAVINNEEIIANSVAMINFKKELEVKSEKYKKSFAEKENRIMQKKSDLEKEQNTLIEKRNYKQVNESEFNKKMSELQQKAYNLQKEFADFQSEVRETEGSFQEEINVVMQDMYNEIKKIVAEILKEKAFSKYYMVVNSEVAIYYDKDNDITADILKILNKRITSVKNLKNIK